MLAAKMTVRPSLVSKLVASPKLAGDIIWGMGKVKAN